MREGDLLQAAGNPATDWEMAKNPWTGKQGYIPTKYTTDKVGKSRVFDAWCPVGRSDAINMISQPGLESGTFILRPAAGMFFVNVLHI